MKIYKYYKGSIRELEVRETAKKYISEDRISTFGYSKSFDKNDKTNGIFKTPLEAIQQKIGQHLAKLENMEQQENIISDDLTRLYDLQKYYKTEE